MLSNFGSPSEVFAEMILGTPMGDVFEKRRNVLRSLFGFHFRKKFNFNLEFY